MTRQEALAVIALLPKSTKEAIAVVVETADAQGDYFFDGEGSVWMDGAQATLDALAKEIRETKPPSQKKEKRLS